MEKRGKKGISPIVATVILISLVITLSILVWIFLSGFIKELVVKEEKSVDTICFDEVEISVQVKDLKKNEVIVSNDGNVPLVGVNIEVRAKREAKLKNPAKLRFYSCGLESGQVSTELCAFDTLQDFGLTLINACDKVTVTPVLLGIGEKSGEHVRTPCETKAKTFTC